MRYLRMLTNAVAGGALAATYLVVLVLQLNPQVPIVSLTALRWFVALVAFYGLYRDRRALSRRARARTSSRARPLASGLAERAAAGVAAAVGAAMAGGASRGRISRSFRAVLGAMRGRAHAAGRGGDERCAGARC